MAKTGGVRFDLTNDSDRKWLEKRVGKDKLRELLSPSRNQSIITSASDNLEMTEITLSSQIEDSNKPKRQKYGGIKVFCNTLQKWIKSTGEHDYFHTLLTFQKIGHISELKHEERTKLIVNDKLICTFLIDYQFNWLNKTRYCDYKNKHTKTPGFAVKRKLFEALFNEPVHIIMKNERSIIDDIAKYGER